MAGWVNDAPVVDAPVMDAPVMDAPVMDAPVMDALAVDGFEAAETDDSLEESVVLTVTEVGVLEEVWASKAPVLLQKFDRTAVKIYWSPGQ